MVEGLAPPTRAVVHSQETICRRLRIQYASLHMCGVNQFWIIVFFTAVKPANNSLFCIELIQRSESSLRRHKLGLTDHQFSVMMTKPGLHVSIDWWRQDIPKHMQKSAWWCSVTYMAVKIWLQFHFKSFVRSYVCSMNDFEVNKTMSQIFRC